MTTSIEAKTEMGILAAAILPHPDDETGRRGATLLASADEHDWSVPLHADLFKALKAATAAAETDASTGSSYGDRVLGTAPGLAEVWEALRDNGKDGVAFADPIALREALTAALPPDCAGAPTGPTSAHTSLALRHCAATT